MKVEATTIDEYFAAAAERETELREVDQVIQAAAPGLERVLAGGMGGNPMIGYGMFHYKYASGREGDWPVVALANQKNYMSVYICAVTDDGAYIAEANADRLGKVSVGRSCIRFKKLEDLNLEVLTELLSELQARVSRGEVVFGI